jgi:ELWxxDGT repeat protein
VSLRSSTCTGQVGLDGGVLSINCDGIESCELTVEARDEYQPPGVSAAAIAVECTNAPPLIVVGDEPQQLRKGTINRIGWACRDPDGDSVTTRIGDGDTCGGTIVARHAGVMTYEVDPGPLTAGTPCAISVECSDSIDSATAGGAVEVIDPAHLELVADINQTSFNIQPANLFNIRGTIFFSADDGYRGRELWKSESPYDEKVLVKDLVDGPGSSNPRHFSDWGGLLVFAATGPGNVDTIWQSDGTPDGTLPLYTLDGSSCGVITVSATLYLCSYSAATGYTLWNGNYGALVDPLSTGTDVIANLKGIGATLFFSRGSSLWKSNSTLATTLKLKSYAPPDTIQAQTLGNFTDVAGTLYFSGTSAQYSYVHSSDGTIAGTTQQVELFQMNGARAFRELTDFRGTLYYVARPDVQDLLKRIGDTAYLRIATNIYDLFVFNDALYVGASDALWHYDGATFASVAGSGSFRAIAATPTKQYLTGWQTTGSTFGDLYLLDADGHSVVKYFGSNNFTTLSAALSGEVLFFAANDGNNGAELWRSDGTTPNTVRIAATAPGTGDASPTDLAILGGQLFFAANDGAHGTELWVSSGAAADTRLLADLTPELSFYPLSPMGMAAVNGSVYFFHTFWDSIGGASLYRADSGGAEYLGGFNGDYGQGYLRSFTPLGGDVCFVHDFESPEPASSYSQLVRLDVDTGELTPVDAPGFPRSGTGDASMAVLDGALYFVAGDAGTGLELFRSEGTTASLVTEINPGAASATPNELTVIGDALYFVAQSASAGQQVWRSQGSAATTEVLTQIAVGAGGPTWIKDLANVQGTLYFLVSTAADGVQLWRSGGSAATTEVVQAVSGLMAGNLTEVGGLAFFSTWLSSGAHELWVSDGSPTGTHRVKVLNPGTGVEEPADFIDVHGSLFFTVDDGVHGAELWMSDGTETGTVLVDDLVAGVPGSRPAFLRVVNGVLYFAAGNALYGRELWRY